MLLRIYPEPLEIIMKHVLSFISAFAKLHCKVYVCKQFLYMLISLNEHHYMKKLGIQTRILWNILINNFFRKREGAVRIISGFV